MGSSSRGAEVELSVTARYMPAATTAAGRTMKKFILNLSFMPQPCVRTAAMVVSEIIDRLSPNMAPETHAARQSARL